MESFTGIGFIFLCGIICTDALYVDDQTFTLLVERVAKLETAVENHPNELTKVQNELREEHAKDVTTLREEFEQQITAIKERHEMDIGMLKYGLDLLKARPVALKNMANNVPAQDDVNGEDHANGFVDIQTQLTKRDPPTANKNRSFVRKDATRIHSTNKRQVENGGRVAFFAKMSTHALHYGINEFVVFDNATTNVGNHYDEHVGLFRAPQAGTYVFSTTITSYGQNAGHFGIFINDDRETYFYNNGAGNSWDETSQTIIVNLNEGDDVTVRSLDLDQGVTGLDHSMLSGFLLYSDSDQSLVVVG